MVQGLSYEGFSVAGGFLLAGVFGKVEMGSPRDTVSWGYLPTQIFWKNQFAWGVALP